MYGTTYRFQEEDAADGTSFAPSDQGRSTRQFPSSKRDKYNKCGYESARTRAKGRKHYHKTIALILASRLKKDQRTGSQLTSDGTHCPGTRKKFP